VRTIPEDASGRRCANTSQISIRQNFRLNNQDHYTIFDMPIAVTNSIGDMGGARPPCDMLNNPMMPPEQVSMAAANNVGILFAPGDATPVEVKLPDGIDPNNGLGGSRPGARPEDGLGSTASPNCRSGTRWVWLAGLLAVLLI
jgi:hypothetical protein